MSEAALRGWGIAGRSPGPYAERLDPEPSWLDRLLASVYGQLRPWIANDARRLANIVDVVDRAGRQYAAATDDEIRAAVTPLRQRLAREGFSIEAVGQSFAMIREQASRLLGQRHYPVQLIGGLVMLRGMLAEMQTGEGKTLTATLPAITAALAGVPVHIVTVNEYLARRDAETLAPLYQAFDLSVGLLEAGQQPTDRRDAYAHPIVYGTNKDVVFDYLRDRLALGGIRSRARMAVARLFGAEDRADRLLMRGLHFVIVDEADSVLIDEARTPLIISGAAGIPERGLFEHARELATALREDEHFTIERAASRVRLLAAGRDQLRERSRGSSGLWRSAGAREDLVRQALAALHLYRRDQHYIVSDGKVQIVDEFTGRVMIDRTWERGLHQAIEVKEGLEVSGQRTAIARLTYQRFFRRYLGLAGMTGTATEVAGELWSVYRLHAARIPTNRPTRRMNCGVTVHASASARWGAVVQSVKQRHEAGQPVLVGTRSVAASETLSALLSGSGLAHQVLNARQDGDEAAIILDAGLLGRITVATNMAGRGTDIALGDGVAGRGGLHVVLTELHESARIDRQFIGRGARQGDPGSFEVQVSLEDDLFSVNCPRLARALARCCSRDGAVPSPLASYLRWVAQSSAERRSSAIRRQTVRSDRDAERLLAFSGQSE